MHACMKRNTTKEEADSRCVLMETYSCLYLYDSSVQQGLLENCKISLNSRDVSTCLYNCINSVQHTTLYNAIVG